MLCTTCLTETEALPRHPLRSKEHIIESLREGSLSSSDIPGIRKNISDAQEILKAYDKEIRRLEYTLAVVRSMAGHLKDRIKETSFLLSPVRRLPDEILGEIFKFSMPSVSVFSCTKRPSTSFLTVCERWRTVALSTPSIWQSIKLEYGGISRRHSHRDITALDHHLSLSKSSPLHIHISELGPFESGCIENFSTHLDSIVKQSSRWVSLCLDTDPMMLAANFEQFNTIENFPNLRSLQVSGDSVMCSPVLEKSPVLTRLVVESFNVADPFETLSSVTHLELTCYLDPTVFDVLDRCPKLISVVFLLRHCDGLSAEEVAALCSHPPHHIPSIKDITLQVEEEMPDEGRDYYLLPSLLSSLYLPSLMSITLSTSFVFTAPILRHSAFEAFRGFFKRSCFVTSLTLCNLDISDEDTISLIQLVPALTNLTIHERIGSGFLDNNMQPVRFDPIVSRRFLQRLNSYDLDQVTCTTLTTRRPLLPKLEHLALTVSGQTFLEEDQDLLKLFVSVVLSRWVPRRELEQDLDYGVECLKYVKLRVVEGKVDKNIWDQLKCLDGMIAILEDSDGPCKTDG